MFGEHMGVSRLGSLLIRLEVVVGDWGNADELQPSQRYWVMRGQEHIVLA